MRYNLERTSVIALSLAMVVRLLIEIAEKDIP